MSDFDIDKFDDYVAEAQASADATRPEPPAPEPVPEPVVHKAPREAPSGPEVSFVALRPGTQDTRMNNDVPEDFEANFRQDVGMAIKKALKERMTRKREIYHLQQKLGFER